MPEQAVQLPADGRAAPLSEDRFAPDLRGFGPVGIVAILAILITGNIFVRTMVPLPVGGALTLLWVRLSRTPWREIGYVRPQSWIGSVAAGVVLGVAFRFAMKAIVLPLLGADPINQA